MQAPRRGQPPIASTCCPQMRTQLQAPQAGIPIPIATNRIESPSLPRPPRAWAQLKVLCEIHKG